MKSWITNLFRNRRQSYSVNGAVVYLDTDILSDADIVAIKQRMTPVFVEFSGHRVRHMQTDVEKSVIGCDAIRIVWPLT